MPAPMVRIVDGGAGVAPEPGMGTVFRERRKALGLTLQAVADAAGLTAGFISQIERGLAAPSLSSLTAVCRTLALDPSAVFAQPKAPGATTHEGQRPVWGIDPAAMRYERLTSTFPGNVLRSVIIHEPPGYRSEPISHEGEELFFVLQGTLTVELDGECHILRPGGSIHFDSRRVHSTWNHTRDVTTILHTCTMDVFGDGHRHETGPNQTTGKTE